MWSRRNSISSLGGDMQHVDALAGFARELDQPLRRHQRGGLVAPHWMRARIILDPQRFALVESIFVLGVERGAATDHLKDFSQAVVILDQQRAGRRSDEHLDAGAAGCAFQLRQLLHVFAGAANEECIIAMHAMMAALHLVGEGGFCHRQRIGVGHLEHRGDATHYGAPRTGFEIFLVRQSGFAEMHLGVHDARQDVQPPAVDHFGRRSLRQRTDRGDATGGNADIAYALAVLIDHGAGF